MPLTDTQIRKAPACEKTQRLFDGQGLYLEIAPSGGKWWRLKYRHLGKEKRLSLGTYPEVSLKLARQRRDDARQQLACGLDPSSERKTEKAAKHAASLRTLEATTREWLKHRSTAWGPGTTEAITASLENHVLPTLGHRALDDIQPRDIREVVQAIEKRGASETAGRVFQRLRSIFRHAVAHELLATDPTYPLKPAEIFKPRKVSHRASLKENEVPGFLRKLSRYEGEVATQSALRLLMLTATRPGELRAAKWPEFDIQRALWRIPAPRMKMKTEHTVPLSRQALRLLAEIRALHPDRDFLFPSPYYPDKPISDGTLNSALARLGYKGTATAHGFRTLFSTCANDAGWNSDVIEKHLAHEERDEVRGAYNRAQWIKERTQLMQWWADHLDALQKGDLAEPE